MPSRTTVYNLGSFLLLYNVFLPVAICDVKSFTIRSDSKPLTGANLVLVCQLDVFKFNINIYKTSTDIFEAVAGNRITSCNNQSCQTRNGYDFFTNGTTVVITITNLQRNEHQKWWTCRTATSSNSHSQEQIDLIVYTVPKGAELSSTKLCNLANESCTLICQTTTCTYPGPSFYWFYSLDNGGTTQEFPRKISPITDNIPGSCTQSERIFRGKIQLPIYSVFPDNIAIDVKLQCMIEFDILSQQLRSPFSDGVKFAVEVTEAYIQPREGNTFDIIENMSIPIHCITSGSRPPATVQWYMQKTGQGLQQLGDGQDVRYVNIENGLIVTNSTLMFQTIRNRQGWTLSCYVYKLDGRTKVSAHNPHTLNILYPPSITSFSASLIGENPLTGTLTISEHGSVTGTCEVDSNPDSTIEVLHADQGIAQAEQSRAVTFEITNATCKDTGRMLCKARNTVPNSAFDKKYLQLNVKCSPRAEQGTNPVVIANPGTTAVLALSVLAYPVPTSYVWKRNVSDRWEMLTNTRKFFMEYESLQYNLSIIDVQRQDYGEYELTIENEEGSLEFTFYLQNKGKPEIPTDISVTVTSPTAITVTWIPGYDGERQQTFHIQYKAHDENNWIILTVPDHNTNERHALDLNGLHPSTKYMLKIYASNEEGNSSMSDTLTFRTRDPESSSVAGIIGGAVGGVIAVCLIIVVICCILRRKRLPEGMKTRISGQRSNKKQAEAKNHEDRPQPSETGYLYSVVNKTAGEQSLTAVQEHNDGRIQGDHCYINPVNLQSEEKSNVKTTKKTKPAKHKQKQQAPKDLSHDGLQYADLSFDSTGKSGKHKSPPKPKPEEGVVYDAVQIGVVGEAYYSNEKENNAAN